MLHTTIARFYKLDSSADRSYICHLQLEIDLFPSWCRPNGSCSWHIICHSSFHSTGNGISRLAPSSRLE